MHIQIVTVGKIKEKYLSAGIAEFTKRLTPFCKLQIVELAEEKMPDNPSAAEKAKTLEKEGERIIKALRPASYVILLDVIGKALSSEDLAEKLERLSVTGQSDVTFIIGGAFGLSDAVRQAADERISFSKMTFTHQMIRLLLVEQVYRAFKINRGEKYHL
ncbi:MAG: 23S rRNA (pseudouridine(1915)-N(3))-methyltransferase RlmH [Sporomusaceae bacterium]|nr:23S rRNA (pseudouridine(1915)-N(3))-methyltransferase RlmH [Sporomusaceae bacterium]